jgi:type IV pilus assembly protein PilB
MTVVTTDNTKAAAAVVAPATRPASLGQMLVGAAIITPDQLDRALAEGSQKGLRLGEALVDMGMVQEDAILPFIEGHLGVPATRLRDGIIDPIAVRVIPRRVAERLDVLALFKVRESLCVAMADPQNLEQIDEIERVTHLRVRPVFAFRSSIQRALPRCYDDGFEVDTVTADIDEGAVQLQADGTDVDLMNVEALVDGSPIINLVNYLLMQAIKGGASDIHIEPSRKFSIVRFRVDGQMYEALRPRRDMHAALVSRIKVMGKMDIAEHHKPQDGRFQVTVEGREVDFRV